MFREVMEIVKWGAIPVLLTATVFSPLAAGYQPLVDSMICMTAILFIERAVLSKEYAWGAGIAAVVVVSSPLFLVSKIFLLMGLACIASCVAALAAFRPAPVTAS